MNKSLCISLALILLLCACTPNAVTEVYREHLSFSVIADSVAIKQTGGARIAG